MLAERKLNADISLLSAYKTGYKVLSLQFTPS